ncbi:MAG: alkaline phosphatase [Bacteroidota bacterium]
MKRRQFFRNSSLAALGSLFLSQANGQGDHSKLLFPGSKRKAKNIIMMVSDGMSTGTLNMADMLLQRKMGKSSNWLNLYRENKVSRGLMDMASANSLTTDSAAASSSWGGGKRVNNGSLNIGPNGEENMPIWQKFKAAGKMTGCVTTVPITHATPSGFCVNSKSRNAQPEIAVNYMSLKFDVMMGGGHEYFSKDTREDKRDLYAEYRANGFQVANNRTEMLALNTDKPILGVFYKDGLPYSVDRENSKEVSDQIPSLAEMTKVAINKMKHAKNGFVLQVEGGKIDWAAHANCAAGLIYDQIAFDEAVKTAIDFAEADGNTLVIITTDHGNANPGLVAGSNVNANFDTLHTYKHSNDWILRGFTPESTLAQIKERVNFASNITLTDEEAKTLQNYYLKLTKGEDGIYNYANLPFRTLAEMQKSRTSVSWISMDHSSDYVELAMFGPGSDKMKPFMKNTELHYFMLEAAEVEG